MSGGFEMMIRGAGPVGAALLVRQGRLSGWAFSRAGKAFEWGVTDCAILAAEAFDVMTPGSRLADEFRGRWTTMKQALRFQSKVTDALREFINRGCVRADAPLIGDIIMVRRDLFLCAHVCFGDMSLSAWPEQGVGYGKTADAVAVPGAVILRVP